MNRLLITIGDSWTQGVGCYEPDLREKFQQGQATMQDLFLGSFHRFSLFSWPRYTAQHLNAELKNLAMGGDANSAAAKRLLLNPETYTKYDDVIVVFLLTDPARFSFFNSVDAPELLQSFSPAQPNPDQQKFCEMFLQHCLGGAEDELLEMAFYLRSVEHFCKSQGYKFYYGSAFYKEMEQFHKWYPKTTSCVHPNHSCIADLVEPDTTMMSDICHHPNELGYQYIGNFIGEYIKQDLTNTR